MTNKVCAQVDVIDKFFSKSKVKNFANNVYICLPEIRIIVLFSVISVTLESLFPSSLSKFFNKLFSFLLTINHSSGLSQIILNLSFSIYVFGFVGSIPSRIFPQADIWKLLLGSIRRLIFFITGNS